MGSGKIAFAPRIDAEDARSLKGDCQPLAARLEREAFKPRRDSPRRAASRRL